MNATETGEQRKCPWCAEFVKSEAILCTYCGRQVTFALARRGLLATILVIFLFGTVAIAIFLAEQSMGN
jgi:uncharacterized protein (DUF983 family)